MDKLKFRYMDGSKLRDTKSFEEFEPRRLQALFPSYKCWPQVFHQAQLCSDAKKSLENV